MSLLRACLLLLPLGGLLAQREEVSFSRAWRFHYGPGGDDATYGPGNSWQAAFRPISGCAADAARVYPDPHRITFSDCATACAYDPACMAWVHDPAAAPLTCTHATAGAVCAPAASNATTIGGQRAAATPLQTAYSFAAADLPEAAGWPLVDAPHDALMALNGSFCESCGDARHGYRHRTVAWYRKAFFLPAEWGAGAGATFLRFEGVMHFAQLWLNGVYLGAHASAYGEFVVRLDNVSGVSFGSGSANVLALRADGSYGSEHWYGGAGLFREVQLVHTGPLAFVEQGVWLPPELALGANSTFAVGEWENLGAAAAAATFTRALYDAGGARVASAASAPSTAQPGEVALARLTLALPSGLPRWSGGSPALYTAVATLVGGGGQVLDARNFSAGFRATAWSAERGFSLNGQPLRQRGFSHHNSFAGAGVALPARLDLFRVQVSRALGANTWRMSHNPYRTALYDVLDAVGTLVWDENRDMGPAYVHQMHDMVKRGRNHAAVVVNSLCNEIECGSVVDARGVNAVGAAMVNISKALDPTRPTTANSDTADGLGSVLDVQGLSHASVAKFEAAKAANPAQPLVLSECCSCSTQRAPRTFDYACMASQNAPGDLPYVTGSLGVWTLFDCACSSPLGRAAGAVATRSPPPPPLTPSSSPPSLHSLPPHTTRLWRAAQPVALRLLLLWPAGPGGLPQAPRLLVHGQLAGPARRRRRRRSYCARAGPAGPRAGRARGPHRHHQRRHRRALCRRRLPGRAARQWQRALLGAAARRRQRQQRHAGGQGRWGRACGSTHGAGAARPARSAAPDAGRALPSHCHWPAPAAGRPRRGAGALRDD